MIGLGLMYKCYSLFLFKEDPRHKKSKTQKTKQNKTKKTDYRISPFTQIFKNKNNLPLRK